MPLFTNHTIVYVENVRVNKEVLELISNYNKVAKYKDNMQKATAFAHTGNWN